ncbi:MAG TPA: hypothetical protein VIK01_25930 [Polyangiaceae bacterium]
MARFMILAVAMLVGLPARHASADDPPPVSQADETFLAGRALLKDKRYAEACSKFQQSQAEDPASGTLLALAYCQELSGLLATSWSSYLAAAQLAEREGHADRQTAATERARALAARVSSVTVSVPPELLELPGFHVSRDGAELERASFGVPIPMDGGSHAFVATAPGRVSWSNTVTLRAEGDQKTLVLPVLDSAPPAPRPAPKESPKLAPLPATDSGRGDSSLALKRASLVLAAGSVVGLCLGTAFALSAKSENDESNADGHCDNTGCDPRGVEARNDALSTARVSTWTFVASGALAAASITLYLEALRRPTGEKRAEAVRTRVSLAGSRLLFSGSF